ncbi:MULTISPECIES: hypothetical protein [unclassified Bradyrhizobium]|uniref:hypothetical protein n=1 Tax=unclassified Bradyrhizobium TaxID=2631580 RepID=UPI0024E0FBAB|nr:MULTISPECIES: hypothetical protein [unclassified Bradyrhizobium]
MKTKIIDVQERTFGQLEIDEWVPFTFRAYTNGLAGPLYWMLGDQKTSLLEMKIERSTGAIEAVLLPACHRFDSDDGWRAPEGITQVAGIPVVKMDQFESGHCEECRDFRLNQFGSSFFVILDDSPRPERCIRTDRVGYFEANGNLCAVGFFDLTQTEVQTVHRWRSYQYRVKLE